MITAAIITCLHLAVCLLLLRPGYWINDDLKIIWSVAGYPGQGVANPFMIYSNVLLGIVLAPLYGTTATLNWYVCLLTVANALSIWSILYLILSRPGRIDYRILGTVVVLACTAILVLNITYTSSAALAVFAGIGLMVDASDARTSTWKWTALGGIVLVVWGGLMRLQVLLIVLAIVFPATLFRRRSLNWRRLLQNSLLAGLLVASNYAFDRLYVHMHPDWNAYYAYNSVRQKLHDAHRLNNLHGQIRRVGWSQNDQELFARWFYPDAARYSLEHISYLVSRTPGMSQDPTGTIVAFARQNLPSEPGVYALIMMAIAAWAFSRPFVRRVTWSMLVTWLAAFVINVLLSFMYKNPDYVVTSTLAGSLVFSLILPGVGAPAGEVTSGQQSKVIQRQRLAQTGSAILLGAASCVILVRLLAASATNEIKQTAYTRILADLNLLRAEGTIASDSLIVSPAHGLPYEWSYPFELTRPSPSFLDTGWITFSPEYERVLREYRIDSLPDALLQRDDVYLMTDSNLTIYLARYYQEHRGIDVRFQILYVVPDLPQLPGYDRIRLFRVLPAS